MNSKFILLTALLLALAAPAVADDDRVRCESLDGLYKECRLDGSGAIVLTRQLSDTKCTEGENWGYRDGRIWVTGGCRGEFGFSIRPVRSSMVVCESHGGRVTCPVTTVGGVQVAKRLSQSSCIQGQSWGFTNNAIWVDKGCRAEFSVGGGPVQTSRLDGTVMCESHDGNRIDCAADTSGGVRMIRQISKSSCEFGRDWGYSRSGVWVTNGCRGEFAVNSSAFQTVTCESQDGKRRHCGADTVFGVELHRQISSNDCVRNRTWGYDSEGIWVTGGCRAEFAVGARRPGLNMLSSTPSPTITCESVNGRRAHCDADTRFGAALYRQLSDTKCIRNANWGVDRDGIWVTGGCRGEFILDIDR
jgi:hypothetical protein